jgi:hypothetical protein
MALGQKTDSVVTTGKKFYVGVGANTTAFIFNYNQTDPAGKLMRSGSVIPNPYVQVGYQFNNRTQVQLGVAYRVKENYSWATQNLGAGKLKEFHNYADNAALVVPITLKYVLLDEHKSLPFYTTVALIPAYGTTLHKSTEVLDNVETTTHQLEAKGFNIFGTVGFGFNYKIRERFGLYGEIMVLRGNLAGAGQSPFRNNRVKYLRFYQALGIGVNYYL